jgi:hypothetical protein
MGNGQNEPLDSPILKLRIEGIRESAKRARFAFLASTIASLCIFTAEYNAYLSWYFWRISWTPKPPPCSNGQSTPFDSLVKLYQDNEVINVSLLGLRIGEGDLVVLGSLALLVFSIWLYFNMNTYYGLIEAFLAKTRLASDQVTASLFSGILLFTTVTLYGVPKEKKYSVRRMMVKGLYILPAAALLFLVLSDVISLWLLPAPYAPHPEQRLWPQLAPHLQQTACIFICIGVLILAFVCYFCARIIDLDRKTVECIQQYPAET